MLCRNDIGWVEILFAAGFKPNAMLSYRGQPMSSKSLINTWMNHKRDITKST